MSAFQHLPLGRRIPDRLHAVSCSLPTMRDVIGYEEKEASTVAKMSSGYPRFVVHPMLGAIETAWRERFGLGDAMLWITSSERMGWLLARHLEPRASRLLEHDGVHGLAHDASPEVWRRAKAFLQHTGGLLSSRAAEDYAVRNHIRTTCETEESHGGDAQRAVKEKLAQLFAPVACDDVMLAPSGMSAFWSAFRAVSEMQRVKGRDTWLQVGWLYLDTAAILAKFTRERHIRIYDVTDRAAIETALREHGSRLAGVVTEVTTNPTMCTADVPWLAGQVRSQGGYMMVDPSIVSPFNVDVVPHADVVLNSLTKYAASEGDVIAGAVLLTPGCPERELLRSGILAQLEPVYPRDVARLAWEFRGYDELLPRLNANARAVIDHLRARGRGVRRLWWSGQPATAENYARLARADDRVGPVLSLQIDGSMERFYDALPLPKGPSFGMRTSLICPFVYLAHYDLITSPEGRRLLEDAEVPVDLLRLSVGAEPVEQIIEALEVGFAAAEL